MTIYLLTFYFPPYLFRRDCTRFYETGVPPPHIEGWGIHTRHTSLNESSRDTPFIPFLSLKCRPLGSLGREPVRSSRSWLSLFRTTVTHGSYDTLSLPRNGGLVGIYGVRLLLLFFRIKSPSCFLDWSSVLTVPVVLFQILW